MWTHHPRNCAVVAYASWSASGIGRPFGALNPILRVREQFRILTRQLPHRETVAVIAHASLAARSGLSRQDLAIHFWSTPWRILVAIGRPLRGVLGFAWKIRVIVFGIAIWQSFSAGPSSHGLERSVVAAMFFILLALTYLMPC